MEELYTFKRYSFRGAGQLILFGTQWRESISPNLEQLDTGSTVVPCSEALLMALIARRLLEVEDSRITEVFCRVLLPFGIEADCSKSRTLGEGSGSAVVPSFNFLLAWMLQQGGFYEEAYELRQRIKTLIVDQDAGFFGSYSGSSCTGVGQPGNTATAASSLLLNYEGGFHR
jgi:hypothetical protein